jgi:ATP:corrinoid adenosyltransferase
MSLELKINKKLDLEIPKFVCDNSPLGEHLNHYEMLAHMNAFSFDMLIGRPGSGKTSLAVSFLTGKGDKKIYRKVFNHIQVVMPASSRNSMKKNPFKKHPEEKLFEELDYDTITTIYERLRTASEDGEKSLLILDDVGAALKNKDIQKTLKKIIFNRRHLKTKIVLMLQSFISCPREIRKLATNVFLFKPSKVEMEKFCEELFETKKERAVEIMTFAYQKPHQYIMLNVESQKMYRNFDEILVPEKMGLLSIEADTPTDPNKHHHGKTKT